MRKISAVCLLVLWAGTAAAAQPKKLEEKSPIVALADQGRTEWEAAQKNQFFAAQSHADMVGKAFALTLQGSNTAFYAGYDGGKLKMSLFEKHYIKILQVQFVTSKRVGQNAFGASVQVTSEAVQYDGIEAVDLPSGDPSFTAGVKLGDDQYDWEKTLDGPQAKAIYEGAKLVLEGEIAARPDDGKVVHCHADQTQATLDAPHERLTQECYVAVRLHRIAFLSGDGAVLKEWRN
jgi:hypothetical protein